MLYRVTKIGPNKQVVNCTISNKSKRPNINKLEHRQIINYINYTNSPINKLGDDHDGAERLFFSNVHVILHIGEHRRLKVQTCGEMFVLTNPEFIYQRLFNYSFNGKCSAYTLFKPPPLGIFRVDGLSSLPVQRDE